MSLIRFVSVCLFVMVGGPACRASERIPPSAEGDTAAVRSPPGAPSGASISGGQDSLAPLPPSDTTAAPRDTGVASSDTVTVPGSTLDSLRQEISRLGTTVVLLSESVAARLQGAAADSSAAAQTASETIAGVRRYGIRTIWAVAVLVFAWILIRSLSWLLTGLAERSAKRRLFYMRFLPVARLVIYTFATWLIVAVVYSLDQSGLLAVGAAVGVGVGFAAQGVLKDFLGGLIIIFDQPFQVGDKVRVGETYGEVMSIGLRATRLQTADDNLVSVPNAAVVEGHTANANNGALDCQVVVDLHLPGWVDPREAREIAHSAAAMSKYTHLDKPIVVLVKDEFREAFLTVIRVKAYVIDTRHEFVFASDVTETAKTEYLRRGMISVGFPVRLVTPPPANPPVTP